MAIFNINWFTGKKKREVSPYSSVFHKILGNLEATYDYNNTTYLKEGYGNNPDVYSILQQQADKTKSIPYLIKRVKDKTSFKSLQSLQNVTKGHYTTLQYAKKNLLTLKAYTEEELGFPLENPNPLQTWSELFALWKIFMKSTGNCFFYVPKPSTGVNKGVPVGIYILPSNMVKIVLKEDNSDFTSVSPIDHYLLINGPEYTEFNTEDIIHTKYPNPFYDLNGSHLYGLSPMRALLKNLESSNEALLANVKTIKNNGVYGILSGKDGTLKPEHAQQIKEKLSQMNMSTEKLSNIAGISVPVEFTKLSVNPSDLIIFDYLKYDRKTIANVLGWSDSLLNNDDGGKYDKQIQERKRVITDNILPDLILLQEALTRGFIQKFRGYEDCFMEFDISELPEMQEDMVKLVEWMKSAPLTENEKRVALKFPTLDIEGMDTVWMDSGRKRIDDMQMSDEDLKNLFE